jgi:hypothetical protein
LQFALLQGFPQEKVMLLLSGFVIAFSSSELLFKFRKTLLVAFLVAILNSRDLLLQSGANTVFLG